MNPWEKRPIEIANLLNPAFCGELLRRCINEYNLKNNNGFPYSLSFLILPLILHKITREILPTARRKHFHAWLQENQNIRIGFVSRTRSLIPVTIESINFLLNMNVLSIDNNANLHLTSLKVKTVKSQNIGEIQDCYSKAKIVGYLFSQIRKPSTVYLMFGVSP